MQRPVPRANIVVSPDGVAAHTARRPIDAINGTRGLPAWKIASPSRSVGDRHTADETLQLEGATSLKRPVTVYDS